MGLYATEHAGALADIRAAGVAITFTSNAETYTASTDTTTTGAAQTVTGAAIRVKGDPTEYESMKLVQTGLVTLLFAPDTYGDRPELGNSVTWEGAGYTVVGVNPLAPDGTDILSRVVIV